MLDWVASPGSDAMYASQIFSALRPAKDPETCLVDLSLSTWVGPGMMASLACFLDANHKLGRTIDFRRPENNDVGIYLSRMGMSNWLDAFGAEDALPAVRSDLSLNERALVEVSRFSTDEDVAGLVKMIHYQNVAPELRRVVSRGLVEAGCNVAEHARVSHGFIAAQVTDKGRSLSFAVADYGVGVFETLKPVGASSERHALRMAFEGCSSTGDPDRGVGLPDIRKGLGDFNGTGALISGSTLATVRGKGLHFWSAPKRSYPGTILDGKLPLA